MALAPRRPNDRGELMGYQITKLAGILGYSDKNKSRMRRNMKAAAAAVCAEAPDEFPSFALNPGRSDTILTFRRNLRRPPLESPSSNAPKPVEADSSPRLLHQPGPGRGALAYGRN